MKKEKQVKVSEFFLYAVWEILNTLKSNLHAIESIEDSFDRELLKIIIKRLQREVDTKFKAIERRDLFTKYKTAEPESKKREEFRNKYLDITGRYRRDEKEYPNPF